MRSADENESGDDGDDGDGWADDGWAAGLEVLLDLLTSVIEDAHEVGTAAVAPDPYAQLRRIDALRQAGSVSASLRARARWSGEVT